LGVGEGLGAGTSACICAGDGAAADPGTGAGAAAGTDTVEVEATGAVFDDCGADTTLAEVLRTELFGAGGATARAVTGAGALAGAGSSLAAELGAAAAGFFFWTGVAAGFFSGIASSTMILFTPPGPVTVCDPDPDLPDEVEPVYAGSLPLVSSATVPA